MIQIEERKKIGLRGGFRAVSITPEILRNLATLLEEALAEGFYVTHNIERWNPQDGMNYPETLTKSGTGPSMNLEIHLGRLSMSSPEEQS